MPIPDYSSRPHLDDNGQADSEYFIAHDNIATTRTLFPQKMEKK